MIFKRILWFHPIKFDSEFFIDMIYNQIQPDFAEGLLLEMDLENFNQDNKKLIVRIFDSLLNKKALKKIYLIEKIYFKNEVALLSALKYKANDRIGSPTK